ncbi:phosphoadenylyl-sulfate reductase [Conexibacter arvalis]|uniref:Adenosine 5'-phosphosulfate reductase n=1 Tax=Conexibacter arvalis TaxID=912552 RepID=A0A840IBJ2_9ACTN|nr:phosphoadenylyl-sulfate reductase [Conexibacter arvalis]MBB4661474.1 phosphoadenosine phosphosulfate reductase [Conexibacter arvalis]
MSAAAPIDSTLTDGAEELSAEQVLARMVERFHPRLFLACSFQQEESVLIDLLLRIEPEARIFTLDTGVLFPETYETWRAMEQRYDTQFEAWRGMTLEQQEAEFGPELWKRNPDQCCSIRKVTPLKEALGEVDAWVVGVRRDQAPTRADTPKIAWDAKHGIWKAAPLADWSERDVWRYIHEHDLPYNPLHDRGYASIGCTHCTVPAADRSGRWAGNGKVECGLHG